MLSEGYRNICNSSIIICFYLLYCKFYLKFIFNELLFYIYRATTFSEEIRRYRLPRLIKENGLVLPYSKKDAEGFKLLLVSMIFFVKQS